MWNKSRRNPRIPVSLAVVLEAAAGKRDARISDISIDGCYIDSIGHVHVGETVSFHVQLPTGHWVQLHGEVVYSLPNLGFGLRFTNLAEEDQLLLEEVMIAHGGQPAYRPIMPVEEKDKTPTSHSQSVRRVLIADDDPAIIHLAIAIIQREGYTVISAKDGQEAHDILQVDANFAAAIFDMIMSHMRGLEIVRYMRSEPRLQHIPVGIMTADKDPKLWTDSFAAGAGIFLPKPFTSEQMRYMLSVLVNQGIERSG